METKLQQRSKVIWLTGLPCSGKTTIGLGLEKELISRGFYARMLDGDITRKGICNDLGFSEPDRNENIRRIAEISKLFCESGIITISAFITPTEDLRSMAGKIIGKSDYINIFIDAPLSVCEQRDVKGMYKKARKGEIKDFTGVSAPFEPPLSADYVIDTEISNPAQSVAKLLEHILPQISNSQ
jgi:adenylylsulfate kinase